MYYLEGVKGRHCQIPLTLPYRQSQGEVLPPRGRGLPGLDYPISCADFAALGEVPLPGPESKCFLQESEVIRSHPSSPGTFCRRQVTGHRSRAENKAFPAAWGIPCPALHDHCPAPALPGAAVSPHRDAGPAAHLSPSTPPWAKTHHKPAAVV